MARYTAPALISVPVGSYLTSEAARLLGRRVSLARRERRWTLAELAERVGVSVVTIRKVERGDPTVALGTAFEAAVIAGVVLFHRDADRRALESEIVKPDWLCCPPRCAAAA